MNLLAYVAKTRSAIIFCHCVVIRFETHLSMQIYELIVANEVDFFPRRMYVRSATDRAMIRVAANRSSLSKCLTVYISLNTASGAGELIDWWSEGNDLSSYSIAINPANTVTTIATTCLALTYNELSTRCILMLSLYTRTFIYYLYTSTEHVRQFPYNSECYVSEKIRPT